MNVVVLDQHEVTDHVTDHVQVVAALHQMMMMMGVAGIAPVAH